MSTKNDIIIIGAGIIGCAIAYRLAKQGLSVIVIEKGEPGQEASWAAAGMLAPQAEISHSIPDTLIQLFEASHRLYPDFVSELESQTGTRIPYRSCGSILAARDYPEAKVLSGLFEKLSRRGTQIEEITPDRMRDIEPELADTIETALLLPNDRHVNNRNLVQSLVAAAEQKGVQFITRSAVTGFTVEKNRIVSVHFEDRELSSDLVINCAGCWAGLFAPEKQPGIPVRPVRGQIVCLQVNPQKLRHLIHSSSVYMVPWPDGRTLVGATMENAGYEKINTAWGVQHLLERAMKLVPALQQAQVVDYWAGLRPDTPDNLPILGGTDIANYYVATGHFRNGILLAPITAELMAELILNGKTRIPLEPFHLSRFTDQSRETK